MICIVMGSGSCPADGDWPGVIFWVSLIVAVAGYKAFKLWLEHGGHRK